MTAHPTQPVVWDGQGVTRFKQNDIVEFLLWFASWRGMTLNEIAPEERAKMQEKVKPVIDKYTKQVGEDLVKQAYAEIELVRKQK